jgi:hypothetical protein
MIKIFIAFIIYSYFFCSMENTCYRNDSFSLVPLFTVGLYGPIKSAYLLLIHDNFLTFIEYIFYILFSLNNIFGAVIFVYYIHYVLKINKILH